MPEHGSNAHNQVSSAWKRIARLPCSGLAIGRRRSDDDPRSKTNIDERIQTLEDKVLELKGPHPFYKEERDYFRSIVRDIPEKRDLTQGRPLSPPESMEI